MKNKSRHEAGNQKARAVLTGASAVHDLLSTLTQWIDVSRSEGAVPPQWSEVLRAVVIRITRMPMLDKKGQELAARAYLIGVSMGMYGEDSAISHGLRVGYESAIKSYRTANERSVSRIFAVLMSAGRHHGRSVITTVTANSSMRRYDYDHEFDSCLSTGLTH
ncbi:hypothetical protein H0X90_35220 [Burkholderia sp. 9775_39]|uniref:hypothetical protein n=1 Tax=unclassified Burkholderia TaxID=2613784 RepID=UPI0018C3EA45|nr:MULTISPECIES: hypothetical protein [unclassified Burkholderia]MBG0882052.1 hypothetical protein [Burkholderia sp. 9775_39]MBG0889010.1 hypothetical protein [Burkholderia sp. 9773_38]